MVFAAPTKQTTLIADREQAKAQLQLLGYQPGDNIYMRFFVPDGDPRHGTKAAARKADKLNWEEVERYQNEGYGVYFVANGGGHTDKDVQKGRALFCEWDDRPIEDQILAWQELNLLEPSMQVGTRKSVHNYWRADLTKEQWVELQEDLLTYTQSDQKLRNPSRVLRLAGAWHIKPGYEPIRCDIIHQNERIYTYEELRAAIPRRQQPEQPTINYQPSISDDVPLYQFLTKDDRALIDQGAAQGSRNDSGAKLARNLIGTAQRLNHLGIRFDGDPRQLFDDYCHRCNPPIASRESEAIWKSAQKDNPTASLTDDALENCAKAWLRNQDKASGRSFGSGNGGGIGSGGSGRRGNGGSGGSGGDGGDGDGEGGDRGKVVRFPRFEPLSIEQVVEKIDELVNSGATGSYLTGQLNRLAAASQFYIGELRKLYYERLGEADLEVERKSNQTEVENLLQLGDQSLDLHDYLPADLATPLTAWCEWLSIRPEVVLLALLAGASSLHKVGTELVIHRNQNFRVPSTIFASLISESGQRKSPIFSNIIRQPLGVLRQEKIDAYSAAMQDYEAAMEAWEEAEDKGSKPEKPKEPTLYYFTNTTGEAIPVQASKAPDKPLLALIDELSGLLKSENSYRSGRGSDKQDLLSYFDGSGQTVLRAGGIKVDVDRIYLSMFGTIQPAVLKSHMADCSDPDGQWARFLFVNQPLEAATLSDDDGQAVQIRDRIADFYRQIDQLPEMEYHLSRDAFKRYQPLYNQLERLRVTHPQPGMRAVYSKMEGYVGRLAINLHVLWELASGKACPDVEIPLFILEMAIQLAKFFVGQVKLVHAFSDDEALAPHILKLIELSKRLDANGCDGWIKAKQYQETFPKKKRPSAQQARDWMNESVALGYGCTRGEGNRLEYHWTSDNTPLGDNPPSKKDLGNLGKVGEHLGNTLPQVESLIKQGIEDNLGNLGNTPPQQSPTYEPMDSNKEVESDFVLEGGQVPQPSPTLTQDRCDVERESDSDLGNTFPNPSPTLPQVRKVQEEAIAPSKTATLATDADADKVVLPSPVATPGEPDAPTQSSTSIQFGDIVRFTNPDNLPGSTQFENLDLKVLTILGLHLALCQLPDGTEKTFGTRTLNKAQSEATPEEKPIQVGDRVIWDDCPGHVEWMNPFLVMAIEGDSARLDYYEKSVPLVELRKVE